MEGRRVALIAVHGIGSQKKDQTRQQVIDGLATVFRMPRFSEFVRVLPASDSSPQPIEIRVYEAYWAETLSLDLVRGSFDIAHVHQLAWFPLLNFLFVKNFSLEYPRSLVALWTIVLVPLAGLLTAAYWVLGFILRWVQVPFNWLRGTDYLKSLITRYGDSSLFGRVLSAAARDPRIPVTRSALDEWLDLTFADIFNYIDSAGDAEPKVPGAAGAIYDVFKDTLTKAVVEDKCTDVQILAHSLGTVIVYHALTTHRDETESIVSLSDTGDGRPRLTHLYTIGSPLEKVRFFWPKLITSSTPMAGTSFTWDNFRSRGDLVAGMLRRPPWAHTLKNHKVRGAWGWMNAHTAYRRHPSFLHVICPALSPEKLELRGIDDEPLGGRAWDKAKGLCETVLLPAFLLALAVAGIAWTYYVGQFSGGILGRTLYADVQSSVLSTALPTLAAWLIVLGSLLLPLLIGYSSGNVLHKKFWRDGVELDRRPIVASETESETFKYANRGTAGFLVLQIAILGAIGWLGIQSGPNRFPGMAQLSRVQAWLLILTLMGGFVAVASKGITGYWRGFLIDKRNRMSLSRLQIVAWTLVVVSAILTAFLSNASPNALSITVPQELWIALGISTTSAIAGPALLAQKDRKVPDKDERDKTVTEVSKTDQKNIDEKLSTMVLRNEKKSDARWGDLLKGDESGNAADMDLGKLQMFFFTFMLVLGYAVAIARLFEGSGLVTALPPVDSSMNMLLGISHTGYLANKAAPHSREEDPSRKS